MNITPFISRKVFARASLIASLPLAAATLAVGQSTVFSPGDLLVGFQAIGGQGSSTTFVYNIGYSVDFRNNPNQGQVANLGSHLSNIYGADWFTRSDLRWGVVGVRDNRNPEPPLGAVPPVIDGDPSATIYISRVTPGVAQSTPFSGLVRAGLVSAAGQIRGFQDLGTAAQGSFAFQTALPGTDGLGATVDAGLLNAWDNYNPVVGASFDIFVGGIEGSFGTGGEFAYLDLYRLLASTNGADPMGVVGVGSWVTTFAMDSSGNISAIPEPRVYALVAGIFGLAFVIYRRRATKA